MNIHTNSVEHLRDENKALQEALNIVNGRLATATSYVSTVDYMLKVLVSQYGGEIVLLKEHILDVSLKEKRIEIEEDKETQNCTLKLREQVIDE